MSRPSCTLTNASGISFTIARSLLLLILATGLLSCSGPGPEPEVFETTDDQTVEVEEEFKQNTSLTLADGLDLSLWATEDLVKDAIALKMDDSGRAWITVTNRSTSSEFDIRSRDQSWLVASMTWESVEDRRAFLREELSPERSEENSWFDDFNEDGSHDWRDLTVQKEEVWAISDQSGNGTADEARLYIRDFHEEITDVAGAITLYDEDVFIGVGPDMWRVRDTDGDGMGDWKESISHGYNVHIGFSGHGMSGATVGPDGRIYWGIGDMGYNVIDQEGNHHYSPNQGGILRSEPDGSNFEVFATGLRNTHEFVFDKYGNLITVDNDGDHPGEEERIQYLVNGSDSGWRTNWQFGKYTDSKNNSYKVWMDEEYYVPRYEGQAAHILPPLANYHAGPTGMTYNPGTALSEEWNDHFFIISFRGNASNSPLYAFTLEESGASFELASDEEVLRGILPVGLDVGPDGALYMTDWIQGWGKSETGRIWKLDTPETADAPVRLEVKNLLAEDFSGRPGEELGRLLGHEDMRVRQKAQFEIAKRGDVDLFLPHLESSNEQLARIHAIWGIAQIGRNEPDAVEPLLGLLDDSDSEVRAQALKMLGDVRYEPAAEEMIPLLQDENARVRFFATEALGRISYAPAMEGVIGMLEENSDEDVYLRHAGAIALARMGNGEGLANLSNHPSDAVRTAAVISLKRLQHPGVARFLEDDNEWIVTDAARAISDDHYIMDAFPALASMLDQSRILNEPLLRRAINANLYLGEAEHADRLLAFSLRNDISEDLRIEALNTLRFWEEPSIFDRVTGRHRGQISNDPADVHQAIESGISDLLSSNSSAIRVAAIEMLGGVGYSNSIADIRTMFQDDSDSDVRIAAMTALQSFEYDEIEEVIQSALEDNDQSVRMAALGMIPELNLPDASIVDLLQTAYDEGGSEEKRTVFETLGELDSSESHEALGSMLDNLESGELAPEVQLDLMMAVEAADDESLNSRLEVYHASKPADDPVAQYQESLYGGNMFRGRSIFYQSAAAQCIRCHVVGGQGSEIGPELTGAGSRLGREDMLEALVDPTGRVTPGYSIVMLTLDGGETVQGTLLEESDTTVAVQTGTGTETIPKNEITEWQNAPSAMPAMGNVLSRSEIRDVIQFLTTLQN
ncbi:MAG: HEAT repeat domain-containing protein [Balneolaceae bacterium]